MENKIEYVLYESEKNNEFINSLKPIHPAIKKIKRTANGLIMEEFYDFSKFKNIKNLNELSGALKEGEYLIIDLNKVKEENEKTYEEIRETISENHELDNPKKSDRKIGDKLYLIKYDELNKKKIKTNNIVLVQLKMNPDETCTWESISFSSISKNQLNDELEYTYGGFSGLYYLISEELIEELDTYYELSKIEDGKWDIIKLDKGKNK